MKRALLLGSLLFFGCVIGAPPGFSDGDVWTAPLVAPLEGDLLLVPVEINDTGPYLFMIDPDSAKSSLDNMLVRKLDLYTYQADREINEADHEVETFLSEVKKLTVGDLSVRNLKLRVHEYGTFAGAGRQVRGILGRDVIADSLVLVADRDRGLMTIATQGHVKPPAGATAVSYRRFYRRRLAKVDVNGKKLDLHLDLGARTSMIWGDKMKEIGLPAVPAQTTLVDEYGTKRSVSAGGMAKKVTVGSHSVENVLFLPYGDKRVREEDYDGALGENFFRDFYVMANWHKEKLWLKRRDPADLVATAEQRIGRFGSVFDGCSDPACVKVQMVPASNSQAGGDAAGADAAGDDEASPAKAAEGDKAEGDKAEGDKAEEEQAEEEQAEGEQAEGEQAEGGKAEEEQAEGEGEPASGAPAVPAATSYTLLVERAEPTRDFAYDVLIEALGPDGKSLGLPRLLITLPKGSPAITRANFDPNYAKAASFAVLDVSPFPHPCQKTSAGVSCVWQMPPR